MLSSHRASRPDTAGTCNDLAIHATHARLATLALRHSNSIEDVNISSIEPRLYLLRRLILNIAAGTARRSILARRSPDGRHESSSKVRR
jgi:hypothetical protein